MAYDPPNRAFLRVAPPIIVANRSINAQGELPKGQPSPVMVLTPAPSWKIINFINRTPRGLISSCDFGRYNWVEVPHKDACSARGQGSRHEENLRAEEEII